MKKIVIGQIELLSLGNEGWKRVKISIGFAEQVPLHKIEVHIRTSKINGFRGHGWMRIPVFVFKFHGKAYFIDFPGIQPEKWSIALCIV